MKPLFEQKWYNKPRKERLRKKYQVSELDQFEAEVKGLRDAGGMCGELIGTEEQLVQMLRSMDWDEIKEHIRKISDQIFEEMDKAPKVHGFMMYRCDDCGQLFRVYLEKGIEEDVPERKPCPFMIKCPHCETGLAQDMYCHVFPLGYHQPLTAKGEFYFANVEGEECGKFRTVGV